jgi:glutamate racemase
MRDALAPIGIFDSGIGGLTVAREIAARLPNEHLIYLGDTARLPYGTKSAETVRKYAARCVEFLAASQVKVVVIACNTVSSVALESLKARFPLPILGVVEPGGRAAVGASRSGAIGVLGQEGTIRSGAYEAAILALNPNARVISRSAPLLVPLAEEGWVDDEVAELVVRRYAEPFRGTQVDTLVLGCTHYPLFRGLMERVVPQVLGRPVTLVDSATTVTADLQALLERERLRNPSQVTGTRRFFMTDLPERFHRTAALFFGAAFDHVGQVDL